MSILKSYNNILELDLQNFAAMKLNYEKICDSKLCMCNKHVLLLIIDKGAGHSILKDKNMQELIQMR